MPQKLEISPGQPLEMNEKILVNSLKTLFVDQQSTAMCTDQCNVR